MSSSENFHDAIDANIQVKNEFEDELENNSNDKKDFDKITAGKNMEHRGERISVRFLIPVNVAGAIIGKGGQNIRDLRSEFNAQISLPDSSGYERILTASVYGIDTASAFAGKLGKILMERLRENDKQCSVRILLHRSQAGSIIGNKGDRIKELRQTTGTRIKVNQDCCPNSTDRICQIIGSEDKIVNAAKEVISLLLGAPPKGDYEAYYPNCVDDSYNYGGFNTFDRECPGPIQQPGRNMRPPMMSPPGPMRGGRSNFDRGFDQRRDNFRGGEFRGESRREDARFGGREMMRNNMQRNYPPNRNMKRNNRGMMAGGPVRRRNNMERYDQDDFDFDGGFSQSDAFSSRRHNPNDGPTETTQVTIPQHLAGSIIGVRGMRIRQIRLDSGAHIKIDKEANHNKERLITIQGTKDQIQNAQFLLQKSVKLYSDDKY